MWNKGILLKVQQLVSTFPGKNYIMKPKEHSKPLHNKTEKSGKLQNSQGIALKIGITNTTAVNLT